MITKKSNKKVLVRIQKIIADSGLCSRRNAEELIEAGRVKVNYEYAEIGQSANPNTDNITVDDKPLEKQKKRYVMMHKPFGYHTTTQDPYANRTVVDLLDKAGVKERLYPVGRLDKNASGLLLLTNDGDWGNKIIHPSIGFEKEYHAKTSKAISKAQINEIRNGIMLKDGPVQAKVKAVSRGFYSITLKAGRHKIVKRIFKYFDIHVTSLKRVRIGPYKLGTLKEGEVQEINADIAKQTILITKQKKLSKPKKIFTKKPRYDQREIEKTRGKGKKSTKKVSPKIDKEFTKRKREEQRTGQKQRRTRKDEKISKDKPTRRRESFKDNNSKRSKSDSKLAEDVSKKPKKGIKKFTASTKNKLEAKPFALRKEDTKAPRRLQSIKTSKPFNKEKAIKKVGKKKDPMKASKSSKKRWK